MQYSHIDSLSLPEKVVLAVYAYCGNIIDCTSAMTGLAVRYLCDKDTADVDVQSVAKSLYDKRLLDMLTRSGVFAKYVVAPVCELPVVADIYKNHKEDWLGIIESVCEMPDDGKNSSLTFRNWWLEKMKFVDTDSVELYSLGIRQREMLISVVDDAEWRPVFNSLPSKHWTDICKNTLDLLYDKENFHWENVKPLIEFRYDLENVGDEPELEIRDRFFLYRYLATGVDDFRYYGVNGWGQLYDAVRLLKRECYGEAVVAFQKSLASFGGFLKERGVFDDYLFNYLYVIALILDSPLKNESRLHALLNKRTIAEDGLYKISIIPLIKNKVDGDDFIVNAKRFVADLYKSNDVRLATYLCQQFNVDISRYTETDYKPSNWNFVENEKNPDSSIVARMNKIKPWMYMLDSIENVKIPKVDNQEERLIYVLEPNEMRVSPFIQKRNDKGEWDGSIKRLWKGKSRDIPECATDDDIRILKTLPAGQVSFKNGDGLLSFVGCDHVYLMPKWGKQLRQVVVKMEHPYLIVDKEDDGLFHVYSNLKLSDMDDQTSSFVRIIDDTHYGVIHVRDHERDIYKLMLQMETIPSEAETRLRQSLLRLDGMTKIYSNLIHDDDAFENADSRVVIRLFPNTNVGATWRVEMVIIPFAGSPYTTIPAEGQSLSILDDGGTLRLIKRNFESEKRHLFAFERFCQQNAIIYEDEDVSDVASALLNLENVLDIITWAKENEDKAVVELMEGCKFNVNEKLTPKNLQLETLQTVRGWIDMNGTLVSSDTKMELVDLMRKLQKGIGKYIRVDGDNYVEVSQSLRQLISRLRLYNDDLNKPLVIPELALASLDGEFDDVLSESNVGLASIRERINSCQNADFAIPSTLNGELKNYQIEGYKWMMRTLSWSGGVCLADDMGLGKTIQTIAVMLQKRDDGPILVVAPTSVVLNWQNELIKFAPSLNTKVLNQCVHKTKTIEEMSSGDVLVASYGMMLTQIANLEKKEWGIIVLDEAHAIKNYNTKAFKSAILLNGKNRIVLTGTPIQNHFSEIWSLFHFSNPGLLGSQKSFSEKVKYNRERDEEWADDVAQEINLIVRPFILRRTKKEVLDELPGIEEVVLDVMLTKEEYAVYDSTRLAVKEAFQTEDKYALERDLSAVGPHKIAVFAMLTKLRELTCSPSLLVQGWKERSSKEIAFLDLLQEIDLEENRVLVFSQFTGFLERIKMLLQEEGIEYLYLDGATPMKERAKLIDKFQAGKTPIFLISLKAGGVGLNLTAANYVVHLDPWWNPAIEQQATDRAYRIGQDQKVTVFHFIAKGTIEEKMLELQRRKQTVSDVVLRGTDTSTLMTKEDVMDILEGRIINS